MKSMNDNMEELLIAARQGDNDARERIYSLYKPLVAIIANGFYLMGGDGDDLLQEGMIGLFEAVRDYDSSKGAFRGFCQMCIRRNIISALKKSQSAKNIPIINSVDIDEQDISDGGADPLELLVKRDLLSALKEYINLHLTNAEQDVLKYYMKGYSYVEISAILSKSRKSVDTALQRARKKLIAFKEN